MRLAVDSRLLCVVAVVATTLGLGGCGLGLGSKVSKAVQIRVTTGFGRQTIGVHDVGKVPAAESVLQLTERYFTLKTSDGGGFVDAIDGRSNDESVKRDWFYYVNGIEAPMGAAATSVDPGDHVWWDLHDWRATENVPAVVGSYPEPFTNGSGGQQFPTVVTCAEQDTACTEATDSLDRAGVKVSFQGLGTGSGSDSLALLVGTFKQLEGVLAVTLVDAGPTQSGVYAQVVGRQGQVVELDGPTGRVLATYHGSIGLIAATEQAGLNEPVWLVTGTDQAGVNAAAAALTPAKLADHFAVAVLPGGRILPLPLDPDS